MLPRPGLVTPVRADRGQLAASHSPGESQTGCQPQAGLLLGPQRKCSGTRARTHTHSHIHSHIHTCAHTYPWNCFASKSHQNRLATWPAVYRTHRDTDACSINKPQGWETQIGLKDPISLTNQSMMGKKMRGWRNQ